MKEKGTGHAIDVHKSDETSDCVTTESGVTFLSTKRSSRVFVPVARERTVTAHRADALGLLSEKVLITICIRRVYAVYTLSCVNAVVRRVAARSFLR